ncbi:MAG: CgeB family protein [Acidimicrobiales bacterium]
MRVLLLGATDVRNSDATLLLGKAMERAGCTVRVLPVTAGLPLLAGISLVAGQVGDPMFVAVFNRRLLARAADFRPDVVFLYGSNWCVLPQTIRLLRRRHGCQVVLWEVNQRIFGGLEAATVPLYDQVYVLDSYFVAALRVMGASRVHHLAACADPDEHAPAALSPQEEEWYAAEVSFVGTRTDERASMLAPLAHTELRVYGTGWSGSGPPLEGRVRDEPVYGLKKAKIYSASRLSLNVHQPHMVHGENFRVFEVAACGGLSISRSTPDLVRLLDPGKEILVFDGPERLRRAVDHYLRHPDQRDEIAAAGRRRVLRDHTYDHRAAAIMSTLP